MAQLLPWTLPRRGVAYPSILRSSCAASPMSPQPVSMTSTNTVADCSLSEHGDVKLYQLTGSKVESGGGHVEQHSWFKANNQLISNLSKLQLTDAVQVLDNLVHRGRRVDSYFFYGVLRRCIEQKDMLLGRRVHGLVVNSGYESNPFLANHIIRMYASQGQLQEAMEVFIKVPTPDTFMWNSIISAHTQHGQPAQAISLYRQMDESTAKPNSHVFVAVLKACITALDLQTGKKVHADILESAILPNMFVGSCLVDMYCKCGSLDDACLVFDSLTSKSVVAWNAMITGYAKFGRLDAARRLFDNLKTKTVVTWTAMLSAYAQHGLGKDALALYVCMQEEGLSPVDRVTFVCLLQACASVGAWHQGRQLHAQVQELGIEVDVVIGSCLVDMYAKCGRLDDARRVFDKLPTKNVVTWGALLSGYAGHSNAQMAIECFEEMRQQGVEPDKATFVCLLVACSHEGLVTEGQNYFKMMEEYGIVPTAHHYSCMVDLLGRSGSLDEAENLLYTIPFDQTVVAWTSLLTACKSHGDVERGKRCFEHLVNLEPDSAVPYALLGKIYANAGQWGDVDRVESMRRVAGARKKPAKACIEVKNKVHEFIVGEERSDLSSKIRSLELRLKEGGHVPHTELVLKAVSESDKEDALCGHAEKLALAYGLLNTPEGTTLLVTKNLRMCDDCHSGTKTMSRLEKREIIVRDVHRVHRFLNGSCSCGDRH